MVDQVQTAQSQKEVTVNANFAAAAPALAYGRHASACSGLTFAGYGGTVLVGTIPTVIADWSLNLTANSTCYIRKLDSTGVVSFTVGSGSPLAPPTDWPAANGGYTALYEVVTGASTVTSWIDYRVAAGAPGAPGIGSGTVTSVGITAPAAGITSSGGPITSAGNITLALANDLAALEGLSTAGYAKRTGADAWSSQTVTQVTADLNAVVGDSGAGGTKGLVPAPAAGDAAAGKYLKADGTFAVPPGGSSPTGTGLVGVTSGVQDAAAITVGSGLSLSGGVLTGAGGASFDLLTKRVMMWQAQNISLTPYEYGVVSSANATNTTEDITGATSLFGTTVRLSQTTGATAGASNGFRSFTGSPFLTRGSVAGVGGFNISFLFGVKTPQADMRMFVGVRNVQAPIGNVEPSSLIDIFGMAADAGEANFSIMHNDGTGTATKVSLGANFPVQTTATDVYRFTASCEPNSADMIYLVERLNTGHTATGTISTDLPTNTLFLNWQLWINNGSTAAAAASMLSRVTATYGS